MTRMTDAAESEREALESILAQIANMRLSLEIVNLCAEQQLRFDGPSARLETLLHEIADARRRRTAVHERLGLLWKSKYERWNHEQLLLK